MRDALRAAGWGNYSLFLTGEGLLVGYLEMGDFAVAQKRMAGTAVNERWQAEMAPYFEDLDGARPDEGFGGSTRSSTWTDRLDWPSRARTLPRAAPGPEPDESCCWR